MVWSLKMASSHEAQAESILIESGLPCEACGSSDALALYDDEHTYCFSCDDVRFPNTTNAASQVLTKKEKAPTDLMAQGEFKTLNKRHLTGNACRKWNYSVGKDFKGQSVQIATYLNEKREAIAQKIRYADKHHRRH